LNVAAVKVVLPDCQGSKPQPQLTWLLLLLLPSTLLLPLLPLLPLLLLLLL
jgi:hypothetical protein